MKFTCPHCQTQLECHDSFAGNSVDCPTCGKPLLIPASPPPKAVPKFRVVFDPQSSGTVPTASTLHGAPQPVAGRHKQLSLKRPLVYLGIALASGLLGMAIPHLLLVAAIALILSIVSLATLHYKCWKAIPSEFARLTPGKAVGYLFIPVFGLYWIFPSIAGLGTACTRFARSKGIKGFGLLGFWGLTLAILSCLSNVLSFLAAMKVYNPPWSALIEAGGFVAGLFFYRGVTALLNGIAETESF